MPTVDLNSDLGEGFGTYRCGDDDAMLAIVTSANVACGMHAGDPEVMARTFAVARKRGVADTGQLIRRGQPGAMIEGAEEAAARVLAMVQAGAVITASGKHLPTPIRSICVHGDSDHAVATASLVRQRLEQAGVTLKPFRPMAT